MKADTLRLELLKICHAHGREPRQIIERVRELETFILEVAQPPTVSQPSAESPAKEMKWKKGENSEPLI
jgi:hypothetical protein